jgi:predicted dehydrogenase
MKVLIVGAGAVSETFHIPSAINLFGVDNVFIADPSITQQNHIKKKFNLENVFDEYTNSLSEVDFVILATPPHIRSEIFEKCIEKNIPVLCEKPAILYSKEGQGIIKQNKQNNIIIGLCHTYRLFPNRLYAKKLIEEGYFGNNINIEISEGFPSDWPAVSGYNVRKDLVPGGVLMDAGIHSLDFLLWTLGDVSEFEYVDDGLGGLESNALVNLKFQNNSTAKFRISRTCTMPNKITITGSGKKLTLDVFEMTAIKYDDNEIQTIDISPDFEDYNWNTIGKYQLKDFTEAMEKSTLPICTMEEGVQVIGLIEEFYKIKRSRPLPEKAPLPGLMF